MKVDAVIALDICRGSLPDVDLGQTDESALGNPFFGIRRAHVLHQLESLNTMVTMEQHSNGIIWIRLFPRDTGGHQVRIFLKVGGDGAD
jgi:hypothetical protein